MKNHSILFLTSTYPDFDSSYRGIFIRKMAIRLQEEGWDVTVVTPRIYRGSRCIENQDGMEVYRFPFFSGGKLLVEHERIPYVRMIAYLVSGVLVSLYAALKRRCRVIHVHWAIPTGLIGMAARIFLRKPMVVTVHGSDLRMALERARPLRWMFRTVCNRARHVISVSEGMKKEMESLGIPGEKITVAPMGIDEIFLEMGAKRGADVAGHSFTILSNRNLQPLYNVSQLVDAVPEIIREEPEARILIAGEGKEEDLLRKRVEALNVAPSVQFLGRIPHADMANLLGKTDVYVSTSLHDGASVSLLEAMASGAFPVVTDIPANREWIRDGENGFLVPARDESSLAKKIVEALHNSSLKASGREMNREIISQKANLRSQTRQMIRVYKVYCS